MERGSSVQQMSCVSSRWSSICCSRIDWRSLAARATMASTLGGDIGECVPSLEVFVLLLVFLLLMALLLRKVFASRSVIVLPLVFASLVDRPNASNRDTPTDATVGIRHGLLNPQLSRIVQPRRIVDRRILQGVRGDK